MQSGSFIWFNANFKASGIPSSGATITFTNSTIQLGNTGQTLSVTNAQITFSPSASCASTTFDTITNTWVTTVPISGSDEIFLDGLAFQLPAGFPGTIGGSVVWNGDFSSNVTGVSVQWKWGAAVYTHFTTDYNALNVKASHQNACGMNNSGHAGTPEGTDTSTGQPFKGFVIGGARGGGGSNFTGSWSGPSRQRLFLNQHLEQLFALARNLKRQGHWSWSPPLHPLPTRDHSRDRTKRVSRISPKRLACTSRA